MREAEENLDYYYSIVLTGPDRAKNIAHKASKTLVVELLIKNSHFTPPSRSNYEL